jgi:hypothetical protein
LIEAALSAKLLAAGRTDDALRAAADALAIDQERSGSITRARPAL